MKQAHCVVIGAGVAGLATAAMLARRNYAVTVLEQSATYGGKVGELTVGGATFTTGPNRCIDPDTIDAVFRKCGKNPRDYWQYEKLPELTCYFWPAADAQYTMPNSLTRIERSLVQAFAEHPKKVRKFTKRTTWLYEHAVPYYIDRPLSVLSVLRPKALYALLRVLPLLFATSNTRHTRYFSNAKTIQLLNHVAVYSGNDPYRAPAVTSLANVPELVHGAYFPRGGMRSVARGLYKLCTDMGVEVLYNTKVTSLSVKDNRVNKVNAGHTEYTCDHVIYSGDIVRLYELLGDTRAKQRLCKNERSTSVVVFYWEVRGTYKQFGVHNVVFSADDKQEYEQLRRGEVPHDPTIHLTITSKCEPPHAAKGTENWFVMVKVPAGMHDVAVLSIKETVKEKLEAMLGGYITILHEEYLSPSKIDAMTGSWQGALYGQATNSLSALLSRPKWRAKTPGNVYRIGASVHPGGGIPLVIRSALIAAREIE